MRFLLDLVDETVHRPGNAGKVAAKPLAIELWRYRLVVLGGDVDECPSRG
jgi:hypothetical protein